MVRVIYNITITTMPILERILSIIAPHDCLGCGIEGALLCKTCIQSDLNPIPERCYLCHRLSAGCRTCRSCRQKSALQFVYVRTSYDSLAKELVAALKFERAYAAGEIIAGCMAEALLIEANYLLVPVPTASSRRRQRGYDQAELITKYLARQTQLSTRTVLIRHGSSRQLGTKRTERLSQIQGAFSVTYSHLITGKNILLVDEVLTTGATLESAARTLRDAGARHVSEIVFAQA